MSSAKRDRLVPQARALAAQGKSTREIGRELGVSHVTVHRWLKDAPAQKVEILERADAVVEARRQVRTATEGRDFLEDLGDFLDELKARARDPKATSPDRRLAAATGAELALLAFELTAELQEMSMKHEPS